jgi:hypothetical protein
MSQFDSWWIFWNEYAASLMPGTSSPKKHLPIAEEHLPEQKKILLPAAFDRADDVKTGNGRHGHLQSLLKTLTREYLS